jgi:hypothetical protein
MCGRSRIVGESCGKLGTAIGRGIAPGLLQSTKDFTGLEPSRPLHIAGYPKGCAYERIFCGKSRRRALSYALAMRGMIGRQLPDLSAFLRSSTNVAIAR